jgi:hypothetical protein
MAKRKATPPAAERYPWLNTLATYNAERARGIVHTQEWAERMAKHQAEFDADLAQESTWRADAIVAAERKRIGLD